MLRTDIQGNPSLKFVTDYCRVCLIECVGLLLAILHIKAS